MSVDDSVCPHLVGNLARSRQGDTPARSSQGVPRCGVPHLRYPHQTWPGGTPTRGVLHLGHPPSDLAGGYPDWGTPPWVPHPLDLARGTHLGYPHQTWLGGTLMGGTPTGGTPPQVLPFRPGWGVPQGGYPISSST